MSRYLQNLELVLMNRLVVLKRFSEFYVWDLYSPISCNFVMKYISSIMYILRLLLMIFSDHMWLLLLRWNLLCGWLKQDYISNTGFIQWITFIISYHSQYVWLFTIAFSCFTNWMLTCKLGLMSSRVYFFASKFSWDIFKLKY